MPEMMNENEVKKIKRHEHIAVKPLTFQVFRSLADEKDTDDSLLNKLIFAYNKQMEQQR